MSVLTLSAKLDRSENNTSWGFRMHGGKDFGCPLSIQRITPGSLAQKCGLQEGDVITKIGDTPTEFLHHKEAQQKIISSGNSLELALERGGRGGRGGYAPTHAPQQAYVPAPVQAPMSPPGQGYSQVLDCPPNYILAARVTPDRAIARAPSPVTNKGRRTPTLVVTPPHTRRRPQSPLAAPPMDKSRHRPQSPSGRPVSVKHVHSPSGNKAPISPLVGNSCVASVSTVPKDKRVNNYALATRVTPERRSPSPAAPLYKDKSPAFNVLHQQMAREPSPVRPQSPNQFARCPSPTFQRLQDELSRRGPSPNRQPEHFQVLRPRSPRPSSASPRPVSALNPSCESRAVSPSRACPSPTFRRLQQNVESRPVSPRRDRVSMKVTQPLPNRSASPIITLTNHGVPPWAWAPRRQRRTPSPAGMVALQPNKPRDMRAQSPSFNELERQMVQKNAYPLDDGRSRSPTVHQFQRDLAGSPTVTIAQHGRSSSPSVRSRPTERRIVRLSSPVPFRKEGSPYRHVAPPTSGYNTSGYRRMDYNRAAAPFSPGGTPMSQAHVPVAVNKQYNTPINMYSMDNVMESLVTQTSAISVGPSAGGGGGRDPIPPWQSGGGSSGVSSPRAAPVAPAAPAPAPAPSGGTGGVWKPRIPTGPRKIRAVNPADVRSMPAMTTGRIPVCHQCGIAIRGPFVAALDKTWCPDHFMCSNPQCNCHLIGVGFVEEDGQLFCERDFEQYLAPRCGKCGRPIMRECVNALKDTFHPECFLCVQCGQPVGTGSFHLEDGQIFCEKDWQARFQTKCYGCQFPIEPGDRWVEALSQNWHSECFNCSTCQVNLEGQSFFAKAGKPFCKKHASSRQF